MFHRWYDALTNYQRQSNRLLSFFVAVYQPLRLDSDATHLNAVRVCADDGLHVHGSSDGNFSVRCYSCHAETYPNLFAFCANVRSLRRNERVDRTAYRFRHTRECQRIRDDIPDCNYVDVLFLVTMFERYANNPVLRELRAYQFEEGQENEQQQQQQQNQSPSVNDQLLCRVCSERQVDVAFLPCGHVFACCRCVMRCMDVNAAQRDSPTCYVCRQPLNSLQYIYFA